MLFSIIKCFKTKICLIKIILKCLILFLQMKMRHRKIQKIQSEMEKSGPVRRLFQHQEQQRKANYQHYEREQQQQQRQQQILLPTTNISSGNNSDSSSSGSQDIDNIQNDDNKVTIVMELFNLSQLQNKLEVDIYNTIKSVQLLTASNPNRFPILEWKKKLIGLIETLH